MSKQHLKIDYNLNSASFGEQNRSCVEFEYNLKEKTDPQMARMSHYNFNIAKNGSFISNYLFEIIHLNHNNGKNQSKRYTIKRHDKLVDHLQQNMDVINKFD